MSDPTRYWIAVSGAGCAMSIMPWRNPTTVPIAQQMWGFPALEEARRAQRIILNEPMPDVGSGSSKV